MVKSFESSGIEIKFGIWFDKNFYLETRNSIMKSILTEFRKAEIEIPYPHITVSNPEEDRPGRLIISRACASPPQP